MGKDKSSGSSTTVVNQTTTPTPTAEETRLNQLEIQRQEAAQPGMMAAQTSGLNLINKLLLGETELPGFFKELGAGISPSVTQDIVNKSLQDVSQSMNLSGLMDSGVAASVGARTAGDIRRASEEFNIGNRLNLLNLALSGQAQVQQPILASAADLGSRLAGLRSINTQGTTTSSYTQSSMNPFMRSFQTSLGSSLGNIKFKTGPFSIGG